MEEIRITLESLYDILRNEKKKEELQKLDETFFIDVISYLKEKESLFDNQKISDDIFAAGERDKIDHEIKSIKRILKELYEKREKKLIDIALNKSRTRSDLIDIGSMLNIEKEFYKQTLEILDLYRKGILLSLYQGNLPSNSIAKPVNNQQINNQQTNNLQAINQQTNAKQMIPDPETGMIKVRFLHPMPSFVWKDMNVYGPFDQGQETDTFPEVAELLVRKGRAEIV